MMTRTKGNSQRITHVIDKANRFLGGEESKRVLASGIRLKQRTNASSRAVRNNTRFSDTNLELYPHTKYNLSLD